MDNFIFFLHLLAWPCAILYTISTIISFVGAINYPGSLEETIDKMNGIKKTFTPFKPFIIALICWSFIIAF